MYMLQPNYEDRELVWNALNCVCMYMYIIYNYTIESLKV